MTHKKFDAARKLLASNQLQIKQNELDELLKITLQAIDGREIWNPGKRQKRNNFVQGTRQMCQVLIDMGATPKFKEMDTILENHKGKFGTIKLLFSAAKLTDKGKDKLLRTAIESKRLKTCQLLLDKGVKITRCHMELAMAAKQKFLDLLEGPADMSNYSKTTLDKMLSEALSLKSTRGIKLLMKYGVDIRWCATNLWI